MRITRLNPEGLHPTPGYHHVTVVEAGRLAFLAGQCPLDPSGAVVGPSRGPAGADAGADAGVEAGTEAALDAQVDQIAANALTALSAVGAGPADVVRSVIYVVSDDGAVLSRVWRRFTESSIGAAFGTASTLLGVTRLGFTGQLVELDLTAALPD